MLPSANQRSHILAQLLGLIHTNNKIGYWQFVSEVRVTLQRTLLAAKNGPRGALNDVIKK